MATTDTSRIETARKAVSELAKTPGTLVDLFDDLSHWERIWKPSPAAWSCSQVAGHLLDAEMVYGVRARSALAEPGKTHEPFDPDRWVDQQRWNDRPVEEILAAFSALRRANVLLFSGFTDEEWQRSYVHGLRGPQNLAETALLLQTHDARHLVQLGRTSEQARQARQLG